MRAADLCPYCEELGNHAGNSPKANVCFGIWIRLWIMNYEILSASAFPCPECKTKIVVTSAGAGLATGTKYPYGLDSGVYHEHFEAPRPITPEEVLDVHDFLAAHEVRVPA